MSTTAAAEPFDRKDKETFRAVDDGIALAIGRPGALYVVKGKQFTRLAPADTFDKLTIDKSAKKVIADIADYTCAGKSHYEWTFGHLTARIENAVAFSLHAKKNFKASATGFAKAVAADPTWKIPAYNLASAKQLAGDKAAAMTALAPWIAAEPIATYVHVVMDPELAPLLDQPALVALHAAKPGKAKLTVKGIDGGALWAADRGLLAITRSESSWGAMSSTVDLQIWDVANGTLVVSEPILRWEETSPEDGHITAKQTVNDRIARLETELAALGFVPAAVETAVETSEGDKAKFTFAKAKFGVVGPSSIADVAFKDGVAHVLRKNTTLANAKITGTLRGAMFVPDASAVVVEMQRHSSEGCDGGPEVAINVVKVSP